MNLNKADAGKPGEAGYKWSELMLERYRLGELDKEDRDALDEAIVRDNDLRSRIDTLEESDREIRRLYPIHVLGLGYSDGMHKQETVKPVKRSGGLSRPVRVAGIAAIFAVCFLIPALYYIRMNSRSAGGTVVSFAIPGAEQGATDRPKGSSNQKLGGESPELSLYLKGEGEILLHDMSVLKEGNTVQLAYTAPAGTEHYGVIFSIDGRSEVTIHYPYRKGQSSLLVSGRQTFLDEAYILDDAPDYEVFVMLISDKPFDADTVLLEAKKVAENSSGYMQVAEAFEGRDAEIVTVIKK